MEEYNKYSFDSDYTKQASAQTLNQYMARTFLWMFVGLLVTFGIAYVLSVSRLVLYVLATQVYWLLLIAELVVVMVLAARIQKLSVGVARTLFLTYSILNGVVFSSYFILYSVGQLMYIFALTAVFFGVFALYGMRTKQDLSGLRPLLIGGLIFLVVAGLLSLFLFSSMVERVICLVGIAVFLCFTAYDTQKIKAFYEYYSGNGAMLQKASIFSALQLYLDFINLFLYLLRYMGRSKK